MVKVLKRILVDSYVGAIGLGLLFAQAVGHFANMFAQSVTNWMIERSMMPFGVQIRTTIPELARGLFLLLVWGLLLYWLYFPSPQWQPEQTE